MSNSRARPPLFLLFTLAVAGLTAPSSANAMSERRADTDGFSSACTHVLANTNGPLVLPIHRRRSAVTEPKPIRELRTESEPGVEPELALPWAILDLGLPVPESERMPDPHRFVPQRVVDRPASTPAVLPSWPSGEVGR